MSYEIDGSLKKNLLTTSNFQQILIKTLMKLKLIMKEVKVVEKQTHTTLYYRMNTSFLMRKMQTPFSLRRKQPITLMITLRG